MKKLLIGNWKMNLTSNQALQLAASITSPSDEWQAVVCPSFPHLSLVKSALSANVKLGAQNVSRETFGAFTGGVCAEQLKDIGCEYVIVGHSERRIKGGESKKEVFEKLHRALEAGLKPILCVGETLEEYTAGKIATVIKEQLDGISFNESLIIAYEPVWSIGTGLIPTIDEVEHAISLIKQVIPAPVIYGGSVNSKNSHTFKNLVSCSGFLVGGASLNAQEFNNIV